MLIQLDEPLYLTELYDTFLVQEGHMVLWSSITLCVGYVSLYACWLLYIIIERSTCKLSENLLYGFTLLFLNVLAK